MNVKLHKRLVNSLDLKKFFAAQVVIILWLASASLASAAAGDRVALLIGNSNYEQPGLNLRNPVRDVAALSTALRDLGFKVTEASDQDLPSMRAALENFKTDARDAEFAMFYFAGHGVQLANENHLIGTDFNGTDASALSRSAVTMSEVRDVFDLAKPKISVLILDACRNNPFSDSGDVQPGLVRSAGGAGMLIAYATDPGNVAYDGLGDNSVFTSALLNHIGTPGLDARLMLGRVRQQVVLDTRGQQVPWVEESVLGEYSFAPGEIQVASVDAEEREMRLWRLISASTSVEPFQDYLKEYPNGLFSQFAKDRITLLTYRRTDSPLATTADMLLANADLPRASSALVALGLLSPERGRTRAVIADLAPALDSYRYQLPNPEQANMDQLYNDATRVSMFLASTTLQRIRTDMVALKSIKRTISIAQDALDKIEAFAEEDDAALPILEAARGDMNAILQSRDAVLRRLDQSRNYYDEMLNRTISFAPKDASVDLLGASDQSRGLGFAGERAYQDAELFLSHVANANPNTEGSYSWLIDLLPNS